MDRGRRVSQGEVSSDSEHNIVPAGEINDPDILPEESDEARSQGPDAQWKFWKEQIDAALAAEKRFRVEAKECEEMYFGPDRDPSNTGGGKENRIDDKTSMIHATIDVLKPLMFSQTPLPVVRRRFRGDGQNAAETDLMAAEIGQRGAEWLLDTEPFQDMVEAARDDWLIAGRGTARVVYKASFATEPAIAADGTPVMDEIGNVVEVERKVSERVCPQHVEWRRITFAPGHAWETLPWCAFEIDMTRAAIKRRFGDEVAAEFNFPKSGIIGSSIGKIEDNEFEDESDSGSASQSPFDTAPVWEIWNKEEGRVVWWSSCYHGGVLDEDDDPLMLEQFFPCPKPMLATTIGRNLNPRPDIMYYERRAKEVEVAAEKMRKILKTISVSGLYPGGMQDQVQKLLDGENTMIGIEAWVSLMEKGGVNGLIDWLPLDAMISALSALQALREQAKAAMFEASGVSDIMRAQGDPDETATAQNLKGRYAGMRMSEKQRKTGMFARDLLRLMFEVAIEHFDLEFWADMTGLDIPIYRAEREAIALQAQMQEQAYAQAMQVHQAMSAAAQAGAIPMQPGPPPQQPEPIEVPETSYEEVLDRLRSDYGRKITLTIETDSTILADEQEDKNSRVEFLSAFSDLAQTLMPMATSGQVEMKMIKELLLFGVRGFPKARTLESMINDLPDDVEGKPQEDSSVQVAKIKAEVDKMIAEMDSADKEKDRQMELKLKGVDMVEDAAKMAAGVDEPVSAPAL